MKKRFAALFMVIVLALCVSSSTAEKYTFDQMVDIVDALLKASGFTVYESTTTADDGLQPGVFITWLKSYDILHFYLYDNNIYHMWSLSIANLRPVSSDFSKMGQFVKTSLPILSDYYDFANKCSYDLTIDEMGGDLIYVTKDISYSPEKDNHLEDGGFMKDSGIDYTYEYCDSLEKFVETVIYWSDAYAENLEKSIKEVDLYSPLNH